MGIKWPVTSLGEAIEYRNEYIAVNELEKYKRCRVKLHAQGIVLRDEIEGSLIKTKNQQVCRSGDFLVAEIDAKVGGFGIVPLELEGAIVSSHYFLYAVNESKLLIKYLEYFTKTPYFSDQIQAKGSTNYAAIRPHHVLEYVIPLPPLDIQHRIVSKIESLSGKINEAKELRQEILNDSIALLVAMAHRNDLSDQEKEKQGWKKTRLADVLTQAQDPVDVEAGKEYPHFGIYSFAKGLFKKPPLLGDEVKATKLYRVHQGQFIYARLNAYEGAFSVITEKFDKHYLSNEFPTFSCDESKVLGEFLAAYFLSPKIWEDLKRNVTGIGGGAGNRRIRLKESVFLSMPIWLPPIQWQEKIKAATIKIQAIRTEQHSVDSELDALLPAILDKAFKGELV